MERPDNLVLEGAKIMRGSFRNFAAKEDRFGKPSKGYFHIDLSGDQDLIDALVNDGWAVKIRPPREEGEEPSAILKVNVNFKSDFKPPKVFMITNGSKPVRLDEQTVGELDFADIVKADLVVNPSVYDVNGKQGISAYLETGYFVCSADAFADKYNVPEDVEVPFE
jgi:hypothetical protein